MLSKCRAVATLPFRGLKKAEKFYSQRVGLKRVAGSAKEGFLEFAAGGGTRLVLFESDSRKSKDTAVTFEVKNLAREMAALRKKGVKFEEYDLPGIKTVNGVATMDGHKGAWFKDPGKNVIGLHEGG